MREWIEELPVGKAKVLYACDELCGPQKVFAEYPEVKVVVYFHSLVVDPVMRQRGIGGKLVQFAKEVRGILC